MKRSFYFLFVLAHVQFYISSAYAMEMYKVSCLPEAKEFRADVFQVDWEDSEHWRKSVEKYGLHVLNKHHQSEPQPVKREETCLIGNITYKMKFLPQEVRIFEGAYDLAVQLFADDKYLGILYPFGSNSSDIFDKIGIKDGKIFVRGAVLVGASEYADFYYKEVPFPDNTSYELSILPQDFSVAPLYNVVELNCFEDLNDSMGQLAFHYYPQEIKLPENYYRFADEPSFRCGMINFKLDKNGYISINDFNHNQTVKIDNCNKQIYQMQFGENSEILRLFYYDKTDIKWGSRDCGVSKDCLSCSIFE